MVWPLAHDRDTLDAGDFDSWIRSITEAVHDGTSSDVPCGDCTACCTSAQFIHIEPDETVALKRIPKQLLFAAPGLPKGNMVMGYDEHGHCPMFKNGGCSIYEHRPRTCRVYDCRVFRAAGISPDSDKVAIVRQAQRWQFAYSSDASQQQHAAIQRAATFLQLHPDVYESGDGLRNPAQVAVLAIAVHSHFLSGAPNADAEHDAPSNDAALRQTIAEFIATSRK